MQLFSFKNRGNFAKKIEIGFLPKKRGPARRLARSGAINACYWQKHTFPVNNNHNINTF